jgi:hypothetical protein
LKKLILQIPNGRAFKRKINLLKIDIFLSSNLIEHLLSRAEQESLRQPESLGGIFELVRIGVSLEKFLHPMEDHVSPVGVGLDDRLQVERGEGDVSHCIVGLECVRYVGVTLKI